MMRRSIGTTLLVRGLKSPIGRRVLASGLRGLAAALDRRANHRPDRWKGLVLGAAGGAAGTAAMGAFMQAAASLISRRAIEQTEAQQPARPHPLDDISLVGKNYQPDEGSTAAMGRIVYQAMAGHPPEAPETKTTMSELVHWSFGTSMGALYGVVRGRVPLPDVAGGTVFGVCVWLFASELMVPLLGLSPGPTQTPLGSHANHAAGHVMYGVVTAATTQTLHRLL